MDELIEGHTNDTDAIIKKVFDETYDYLFINTDSVGLFKSFDKLILVSDT